MAVARMQRALIIGHADDAAAMTASLQRGGVIHVEKAELVEADRRPARLERLRVEGDDLGDRLDDARFVLDLLGRYRTPPDRPFASFISEKFHLERREFEAIDRRLNFGHLLSVCREAEAALTDLDREAAPLARAGAALGPWLWLDVPLASLSRSTHTVPVVVGGDDDALAAFASDLDGRGLAVEVLAHDGHALVIAHRDDAEAVREAAREAELTEGGLPPGDRTPVEELELVHAAQASVRERRTAVEDRIRSLTSLYGDVLALVRSLENSLERVTARQHFGATERAVFIEGWVRADRLAALAEALAPFKTVDVCLTDPLADEEPPAELANQRWLQPFELLTRLYGMPAYRELDPTPMLAFPFALFFGICVGDAGYGALLMLFGALFLKKLDLAENPRRFMRLMIYGGAAAIIFGIITGSYFAIDAASLPAPLKGAMLFDPLYQSVIFFVLSVALGVLHVTWGVALEAWDQLRNGNVYEAVAVQGSTLLVVVSAVVAVTGWLSTVIGGSLPSELVVVYPLSLKALLAGAAGLVLFSGGFFKPLVEAWRDGGGAKGRIDRTAGTALALAALGWVLGLVAGATVVPGTWVLGVMAATLVASSAGRRMVALGLLGLYNLYGMTSFIGDILSYARLMALGLASLLIGSTVNRLAGLVLSGMPSWPGAAAPGAIVGFVLSFVLIGVAGLLVLVAGHAFNVVVNLLGAFVHPMRLQFVEFFSKFYEGRGRPFRPLAYTTGVLVLDEPET